MPKLSVQGAVSGAGNSNMFGTAEIPTVALGLLAYDLAGWSAGAVLATGWTIKMVLYVVIAPIAAAYADRLPRRLFLTLLDVVRAAVVLALPFVTGGPSSPSPSPGPPSHRGTTRAVGRPWAEVPIRPKRRVLP